MCPLTERHLPVGLPLPLLLLCSRNSFSLLLFAFGRPATLLLYSRVCCGHVLGWPSSACRCPLVQHLMPVCLLGLAVIINRQKLLIMEPERQDQSRQRVQGSVATRSPVYLHYLSLGLIRGVNRQCLRKIVRMLRFDEVRVLARAQKSSVLQYKCTKSQKNS